MKKTGSLIAGILFVVFLVGCSSKKEMHQLTQVHVDTEILKVEEIAQTESTEHKGLPTETEDTVIETMWMQIGEQRFSFKLYENEASSAFSKLLPLTITMSDMNGNEKYYYLPENLAVDASNPSEIKEGDLMLYGSNCLVLFYESFPTSYSYTPLGYVENATGLADALGALDATITFYKE